MQDTTTLEKCLVTIKVHILCLLKDRGVWDFYMLWKSVCVYLYISFFFFLGVNFLVFFCCLFIYIYIYICIYVYLFIVYCHDIKFNVEANLCVSGSTLRDQNALDISRLAESCNAQCGKIWKGRVNLKVCLCSSFFFLVCLKCSWEFKTVEVIP